MCVSALHEVTEFGDDNAQFAFGVYSQFGVEIEESIKKIFIGTVAVLKIIIPQHRAHSELLIMMV